MKLSKKIIDSVEAALLTGQWFDVACAMSGITRQTGYTWKAKGQEIRDRLAEDEVPEDKRDKLYLNFLDRIERAELLAEGAAVVQLRAHGKKDPRSTIEFLKRRYQQRWGDRIAVANEADQDFLHELRRIASSLGALPAGAETFDMDELLTGRDEPDRNPIDLLDENLRGPVIDAEYETVENIEGEDEE